MDIIISLSVMFDLPRWSWYDNIVSFLSFMLFHRFMYLRISALTGYHLSIQYTTIYDAASYNVFWLLRLSVTGVTCNSSLSEASDGMILLSFSMPYCTFWTELFLCSFSSSFGCTPLFITGKTRKLVLNLMLFSPFILCICPVPMLIFAIAPRLALYFLVPIWGHSALLLQSWGILAWGIFLDFGKAGYSREVQFAYLVDCPDWYLYSEISDLTYTALMTCPDPSTKAGNRSDFVVECEVGPYIFLTFHPYIDQLLYSVIHIFDNLYAYLSWV